MIIVIDGPAGSGKSSTAKELANRLNLKFLDSGALYRALTYKWLEAGKPEKQLFFKNLPSVNLKASSDGDQFSVEIGGEDVTGFIRTGRVSEHVSEIATAKQARSYVNSVMRDMVKYDTFIADGRDLGTAVFPDADLKFYMDASIEERASRRFEEMKSKQNDVSYSEVLENVKMRDHTDRNRKADPLRKAEDAIRIDTTGKTFEEQVDEMSAIIKSKLTI